MKKLIQKKIRQKYWTYVSDVVLGLADPDQNDGKTNSTKRFYSYLKSLRSGSSGIAPLKVNGHLVSHSEGKAAALNDQFVSVFSEDTGAPIPDLGPSPHADLPDIQISPDGVRKLLSNILPHKAAGPDEIHARVLKELHEPLAPILGDLFQRSLDSGEVPEDWRQANVAPAFKKGDKNKASNYRPISLTSITCKLLEHIIASHTMKHLEERNALYYLQHGFRKMRSCETQLLSLIQDLTQARDNRTQTDLVVMDFAKAFDKVSHRHLAAKLTHYGIRGNTLRWITNFLKDRTQRVVVEGKSSGSTPVSSGVPQGTVLGPILFLIYIDDLPSRAQHSTIRLFADDCIIQKSITAEEDCLKLQQDIDNIAQWERDWLMEFHPDKCQVLSIPASRSPIYHSYHLHDTRLSAHQITASSTWVLLFSLT